MRSTIMLIYSLSLVTLALPSSYASDKKEVAITIYNQDLGLVKEIRTLEFQRGLNQIKFTDVASAIDPTSVRLHLPEQQREITLLEQNYQFDLIGSEKLMNKYIDKQIQVVTKEGKTFEGTLLSTQGALVLQEPQGSIRIISRDDVRDLGFPSLPEGLFTRPTLLWLIDSQAQGQKKAEVSYLTNNINWHAEYVATVNQTETALDLAAWVSIDNRSGATYEQAKVKLIAGEVHRVQPPISRAEYGADARAMAKAPFEEKAFFEYHLYTLARPATIGNNEIKQIALFEPARVETKKIYLFEYSRSKANVLVNLEFVNSPIKGLGIPLPAGKIRVMKKDLDGSLEFVGEDLIDHTPRDEKVRIYLGNAFDLVGERVTKNRRRISDDIYEEDYEITLRNHKQESVTILVIERLYGNWEIKNNNHPFTKKDAYTIEFPIPVTANDTTLLSYTARYRR